MGFVYLCVTMMAMIPTESVQEQCVQALALQLAGLRSPEINTLLGTVPTPDELPLELPSGLALYEQELQRYGEEAETILGRCAELGIGVYPSSSASYPRVVRRHLGAHCPPLLYTLGAHELLGEPRRVAVIGTRMPDGEGLAHVRRVTRELVGVGGRGIAVVATGLDETYPREHAALQCALLRQGGLVLSEYPPGSPMGRWQFVVRDRLLATLATEVLVAQCGLESGTLHTVRFAQRYGVPCFAQQYEVYSEVSGGNQWLLLEGLAQPHQLLLSPS